MIKVVFYVIIIDKFEPFELEKSIATLRSINYSHGEHYLGEEKCKINQEEINSKFTLL